METTLSVKIFETPDELGRSAAADAARVLRQAIAAKGEARVIVATGASQFAFLAALAKEPDVDWSRITCFHLDEYLGMPDTHPASFRRYLRERVVAPLAPKHFEFVDGTAPDPEAECARVGALLRAKPIDVAFVGIGENGHLAFNDPPADFTIDRAYIIVELDEPCRRQQLGEGWFKSLDEVPRRAISMSIPADPPSGRNPLHRSGPAEGTSRSRLSRRTCHAAPPRVGVTAASAHDVLSRSRVCVETRTAAHDGLGSASCASWVQTGRRLCPRPRAP